MRLKLAKLASPFYKRIDVAATAAQKIIIKGCYA